MRLDMYLEGRFHLSLYDDALAPIRQAAGYAPPKNKPDDDPTLLEITGVSVRVGHWRKLDPLRHWLVDLVQKGHDGCRPAFVSPETLVDLEDQLDRVSNDPASITSIW